jgi:hypothetical protein
LTRISYKNYLYEHPFYSNLGINPKDYIIDDNKFNFLGKLRKKNKQIKEHNLGKYSYALDLNDLIRLHYLITSRKVTTILEFGVGASTAVFDNALSENKKLYSKYVSNNLRRANAFECHSVDNQKKWIDISKQKYKTKNTFYHFSQCRMSMFNNRICSLYDKLPDICPDFIYLDGPNQDSVLGDVNGISTRALDRLPMAADILCIEHFLLPGTLIVVDGRTANARFLRVNLQRNWKYSYVQNFDQHFFELNEKPLGRLNRQQVNFSRM